MKILIFFLDQRAVRSQYRFHTLEVLITFPLHFQLVSPLHLLILPHLPHKLPELPLQQLLLLPQYAVLRLQLPYSALQLVVEFEEGFEFMLLMFFVNTYDIFAILGFPLKGLALVRVHPDPSKFLLLFVFEIFMFFHIS